MMLWVSKSLRIPRGVLRASCTILSDRMPSRSTPTCVGCPTITSGWRSRWLRPRAQEDEHHQRDIARGVHSMRNLTERDTNGIFEQLDAFGWISRDPKARSSSEARSWNVNTEVHRVFAERAKEEIERRQKQRQLIAEEVARKRGATR